jgi:hypothetical protein
MGLQKDYRGSMSHPTVLRFCTLLGDNRGRRNIEFGQLDSKKRFFGKFRVAVAMAENRANTLRRALHASPADADRPWQIF